MRTSRGRVTAAASYFDGSSPEGSPEARADEEWVPRLEALPTGARAAPYDAHAPAGPRAGSLGVAAVPAAAPRQGATATAVAAHAALDWEEAELLAQLSPESQKRERRRIANRDCARRIRQRQTVRPRGGGGPACAGLRRLSPPAAPRVALRCPLLSRRTRLLLQFMPSRPQPCCDCLRSCWQSWLPAWRRCRQTTTGCSPRSRVRRACLCIVWDSLAVAKTAWASPCTHSAQTGCSPALKSCRRLVPLHSRMQR